MWSHDSDHVGLTHQTFWNSDFVTELLIPDKKVFFSFKWLEIDGFKVLKWKNRVISHQKLNITRRPTFMEVQTAFSPPRQLFKSKMRTKSEEKTHIFACRWAPMHHDEYGLWFAIWIFFWTIKQNSTAISIFFRYIETAVISKSSVGINNTCIVDAQTLKLVILHPASSNATPFCWLSFWSTRSSSPLRR